MSFEDIPEDIPEDTQESHSCPECELGEVTLNESFNAWECDECDFTAPAN